MIQMDLVEAIRQRELGMERVLDPKSQYRTAVEAAIKILAMAGQEFSSDDVRELAGDPPHDVSTNTTGALFSAAAKAGLIQHVGYRISARVKGHGNLVRVWIGV